MRIAIVVIGLVVFCQSQITNKVHQIESELLEISRTKRSGDPFDEFVEKATNTAQIVNGIILINQIIEGKAEHSIAELLHLKTSLAELEKVSMSEKDAYMQKMTLTPQHSELSKDLKKLADGKKQWREIRNGRRPGEPEMSKLSIFEPIESIEELRAEEAVTDINGHDPIRLVDIKIGLGKVAEVVKLFGRMEKKSLREIQVVLADLTTFDEYQWAVELGNWNSSSEIEKIKGLLNELPAKGFPSMALGKSMTIDEKMHTLAFPNGHVDLKTMKIDTEKSELQFLQGANLKEFASVYPELKGIADPKLDIPKIVAWVKATPTTSTPMAPLTELAALDLGFTAFDSSLTAMPSALRHVSETVKKQASKGSAPASGKKEEKDGGSMVYIFVGVGALILVLILVAAVFLYFKKKKKTKPTSSNTKSTGDSTKKSKKGFSLVGMLKKSNKSAEKSVSGSKSADVAKTETAPAPGAPEASSAMATARTETPTVLKSTKKPRKTETSKVAPAAAAPAEPDFIASDYDPTVEQV